MCYNWPQAVHMTIVHTNGPCLARKQAVAVKWKMACVHVLAHNKLSIGLAQLTTAGQLEKRV